MFKTFDAWREQRRNRVTFRELAHLSDTLLDDVGLTRGDLAALRRGRAPSSR